MLIIMKKGKIIARISLWIMFFSGIMAVTSEFVFPEKMNFLSPYVIWGYGIVVIVISILYLMQNYQKPKPRRKK